MTQEVFMAISITKGKQRFWLDPKGNEIPYSYVKKADRKRDKAVNQAIAEAKKIAKTVEEGKQRIQEIIQGYLSDMALEYGETWKGNATIRDFSDVLKVEVNVGERIDFDEKVFIAKEKIDKCINSWAKGSSQKIKLLVDKAFKVDKKGNLNKKMLLGLRSLNIEDTLWKEAMDIISESIQIVDSVVYYQFYEKEDQQASYKGVEVNFSKV